MTIKKNIAFSLDRLRQISFCLTAFFLPLSLKLNNISFTVFISSFILLILLNGNKQEVSFTLKKYRSLLLFCFPFLLTALGLLYTSDLGQGVKDLERVIPLLLLPVFAYLDTSFFNKVKELFFYFLIAGILVTITIAWTKSIALLLQNNDPIYMLYSPKYAYKNLTEHISIHSTYLGLFLVSGIGFLVYKLKEQNKKIKVVFIFLILIFIAFLFNLQARNSIFSFILVAIIYLISIKKTKVLLLFLSGIFLLGYIINNINDNRLRDRFIKGINIFEKKTIFSKKDNRFERLKVSFNVFKEHPIIGPGTGDDDALRKKYYYINRDSEAYNKNYNAHNQFFEYLSTFGLIGGVLFLTLFYSIFKIIARKKDYWLLFLFGAFFITTLTESALERSWGVIYFAILIALLISTTQKNHAR